MNEQQTFWAKDYAQEYIEKNQKFDRKMGVEGWSKILEKATAIEQILECGCNIGRNIGFLNEVLPDAKKTIIEISKPAYDFVTNEYQLDQSFNGTILQSNFEQKFDLVFTMGVLIHIHPDDLLENINKMWHSPNSVDIQ